MGKKLLVLLGLVFMASGCATTAQDQTMVTQLQLRMGELERGVEAKDAKISNLEYEIKDLSYDVKRLKEQARSGGSVSRSTRSVSSASADDGEIIRVPVSAEDVQRALKAAGYYQKDIDGNVGSGTKAGIIKFQKDNNLKADGLIGKQTWAELKTYLP